MTNLAQLLPKKRLPLPRTQNNLDSEMSHSWSSALHWKCSIPARVSRVRIPSSPPEIIKTPTKSVGALFLAGFQPLFYHKVTSMYNEVIK